MKISKQFYCFNEGGGDDSGGAGGSEFSSAQQSFLSSIPESYKAAPYISDIARSDNPTETLWAKFNNMHDVLQTRPGGMPKLEDATENWERWAAMVAPPDITAYGDVKPTLTSEQAAIQETIDGLYSPEYINPLLDTARKVGIQPYQLKALANVFNTNNINAATQSLNARKDAQQQAEMRTQEQAQAQEADWQIRVQERFGVNKETAIKDGMEFFAKHIGADRMEQIRNLPNEQILDMIEFAHNIKKTYLKEGSLPNNGISTAVTAVEKGAELKNELAHLMKSEAASNLWHSQYEQTQAQINNIAAQLAKLGIQRRSHAGF